MVSADQAAQDWVAGLSAKTAKMQASVQAVTVAPGQAAARQKTAYLQGVQARVDVWAARVGAVSLADWQQAMIQKGIPRVATGAAAAQQRMVQVFAKLLPFIDAGKRSLPARGTFEQNKARMNQWVDYMHGYKG